MHGVRLLGVGDANSCLTVELRSSMLVTEWFCACTQQTMQKTMSMKVQTYMIRRIGTVIRLGLQETLQQTYGEISNSRANNQNGLPTDPIANVRDTAGSVLDHVCQVGPPHVCGRKYVQISLFCHFHVIVAQN